MALVTVSRIPSPFQGTGPAIRVAGKHRASANAPSINYATCTSTVPAPGPARSTIFVQSLRTRHWSNASATALAKRQTWSLRDVQARLPTGLSGPCQSTNSSRSRGCVVNYSSELVPGCAGAGSTISPAFTPFLVNPAESGWHESIETIEIQLVNLIVYFFKLGVPDVLLDANIFSVIRQFKPLIIRFCTSWRHFPP